MTNRFAITKRVFQNTFTRFALLLIVFTMTYKQRRGRFVDPVSRASGCTEEASIATQSSPVYGGYSGSGTHTHWR